MEEVDLSQFAGQDIYIAFRCCSEKMQSNLWLWNVMVTDKLQTPTITKFERNGDALHAEWTAVDGATGYYLYFGKETDEVNQEVVFAPASFFEEVTGDVTTSTGKILFKSSGCVTLKEFPEGLEDCKFMVTTSGPSGTSELTVEGTKDGETWQIVGTKTSCKEYDSDGQEVDLSSYLKDKKYKKLRFKFKHGGRNACIKYLTLIYNDGKVYTDLAAGGVYNTYIDIKQTTDKEFDSGKYKIWVAAGWKNLFYDESAPAYYEANPAAIGEIVVGEDGMSLTNAGGALRLSGLKSGYTVTCTSASGALLFRSTASAESMTIPMQGVSGVAVVSVSGEGKTSHIKTIIR